MNLYGIIKYNYGEICVKVKDSYLGLGIHVSGYGCYIQVSGFKARYKSALHLLRTIKKGVAAFLSSVYV